MANQQVRAIILFTCVVLIFGLNYIFVNLGLKYSPPVWLAFFRALLGFAGFAILLQLVKIKGYLTSKQKLVASLLGIPGSVLFFGLWFLGGTKILPGLTSVIIYTNPLWIAFLSIPLLGEQPKPLKIVAILIGLLGVVLASKIDFVNINPDAGAIIEVGIAGFCWAFFNVTFKKFYKGEELIRANLWQLSGSLLPLFVWATLSSSFQEVKWTYELAIVLLWIGVLGTAIAYILWLWLLSHYTASSLGAYSFLNVVVALISSIFIFGERINLIQALGIIAIMISIYLISKKV